METARDRSVPFDPCAFAARPLHVAVVHAGGAICHIAADLSEDGLEWRLGEYVRGQASWQLWPEDAADVLGLLADGRPGAAVDLYFEKAGARWGREELVRESVDLGRVDSAPSRSTNG